ncbi:MAG: chemotaxis protein CheX, partial [Spirochaetales bacterium]|nr:chemotaxis protein CheX [Spirochaetales bacterium]
MEQDQLKIFIQSMLTYFNKITGTPIDVGVPFLKKPDQNILLQYTGAIGISGKMRGAIYLTADEEFLYALLIKIMPTAPKEKKQLAGMVGELANTIAGNAQSALGKDFLISIPMI